MKQSIKNGFTLIEALLSILICSIVSCIGILYIECCMNLVEIRPLHQNQMAILQIRQILSISHDIRIENNTLLMRYKHQEVCFKEDRNRLVQTDGYVIWMEGIENVIFYEENNEIFIKWTFNGQRYQSQLY